MSDAKYRVERSTIIAETTMIERTLARLQTATTKLPAAQLEAQSSNAITIDQLDTRAQALANGEVITTLTPSPTVTPTQTPTATPTSTAESPPTPTADSSATDESTATDKPAGTTENDGGDTDGGDDDSDDTSENDDGRDDSDDDTEAGNDG